MKMKCFFLMTVLTALPLGGDCEAQTVTPQACEQSIVTPQTSGRYLWLPIEEKAPEGKVLVIADGKALTEQNVRSLSRNIRKKFAKNYVRCLAVV